VTERLLRAFAHPGEGVAALRGRAEAPQAIAAERVLDLEHVGAELAEHAWRRTGRR
jgi:hypothetical protein